MKILNYGSMNIDNVYQVEHMIHPGETQMAIAKNVFAGGKGLNQSIAIAKAGGTVYHAGVVGEDGAILMDTLAKHGVDTRYVKHAAGPSGHTVIQVDSSGQNSIIVFAGENMRVLDEDIERVLSEFNKGDLLILQNELDHSPAIMRMASERGMTIIFNPSPVNSTLNSYPLACVDWFLLNEIEGKALTQETEPKRILAVLKALYPNAGIVLTLGRRRILHARRRDSLSTRLSGSAGRYHRRRRYLYGLFRHRAFPRRRFIQGDGASRQGCRYRCKPRRRRREHSLH